MKKITCLLILFSIMSLLCVKAQGLAQLPSCNFQSTSTMRSSGSTMTTAAQTGVRVTGTTVCSYNPVSPAFTSRPRRVEEGGGFEDEGDEPVNGLPGEPAPLGDAVLPMMLLLGAYCGFVYYRRRKHVKMVSLQETLNG